MGMERNRTPVAANTALAIAGAMAMIGVSPPPVEGGGFANPRRRSGNHDGRSFAIILCPFLLANWLLALDPLVQRC